MTPFEIFAQCPPGLEPLLAEECRELGFDTPRPVPGGVSFLGGWAEVAQANRSLRGAGRILARFAEFRAFHLAQLDKRARKVAWGSILRPDMPVRVEVATNKRSKIYHAGAARQRIERAITETLGCPIAEDGIALKVRIDDNLVTFSVDTSGEPLHRRGCKQFVGKAPMRETLAALFLRACGYDGSEPVLDPMCGSGTFVLEAAEWACALRPGRGRGFAFEHLSDAVVSAASHTDDPAPLATDLVFRGFDRDQGAVSGATANAQRAGVAAMTEFTRQPVAALTRPDGPPGLVIVNPPYGARIGNRKLLFGLYAALGDRLKAEFAGWRVGLVTSDGGLAKASGLPFTPDRIAVPHGGLKITLHRTDTL